MAEYEARMGRDSMVNEPGAQSGIQLEYGYGRTLDQPFDVAVQRARESLKSEGFGVLCEIDIKEKLKEKLGVDFMNYKILGACNPPLAYQALQKEMNIGLLLPCNVVVWDEGAYRIVAMMDASLLGNVIDNPKISEIASEVSKRLDSVLDEISSL